MFLNSHFKNTEHRKEKNDFSEMDKILWDNAWKDKLNKRFNNWD